MDFLEKDLETIIYDCLTDKELYTKIFDNGLEVGFVNGVLRQLYLGNYGRLDLLTYSFRQRYVTLYELKNKEINLNSLLQAATYLKAVKRYIKLRFGQKFLDSVRFEIILIGKNYCTKNWVYLFDGILTDVRIFTYNYSIDGIRFIEEDLTGMKLINEGF